MAEHEREMISQQTKAALGAAKARGVQLGGDRGGRATPAARACALNARGIPAPRGGSWQAVTVRRTLERTGVAG